MEQDDLNKQKNLEGVVKFIVKEGREKNVFSIWKKLEPYLLSFDSVFYINLEKSHKQFFKNEICLCQGLLKFEADFICSVLNKELKEFRKRRR